MSTVSVHPLTPTIGAEIRGVDLNAPIDADTRRAIVAEIGKEFFASAKARGHDDAKIAEVVVNTLPRSRNRHDMHRHPHYYRIRNHLIEFLVDRSRAFDEQSAAAGYDPRHPPVVRPGLEEGTAHADESIPARPPAGSKPLVAVAR